MLENKAGKKVLIAGGSGLLGKGISEKYLKSGFEVSWLSRKKVTGPQNGMKVFHWNPEKEEIENEAVEWADILINLAGSSIGETRWTEEGKKDILESRLKSIKTLTRALIQTEKKLDSFIGVSGAGYYGPGEVPFEEKDPSGNDFPAFVAKKWEEEYLAIPESAYEKLCILRLGVVLSTKGGAMPKMMQPIKYGIGAAIGTGKQGLNWIHIEDAVNGFFFAQNLNGIFNLSAPELANNLQVTLALAKAMKRKIIFPPVPSFILELALGNRAKLLTQGNHSKVSKIQNAGFAFQHPKINEALEHLIKSGIRKS